MKRILKWLCARSRWLLSRKLLVPYLLSFSALVVVAVLLFSLWYSLTVRSELQENIHQSASTQTRQAAATLENTISNFYSLTVKLNILGQITPASFKRDMNEAYQAISYYNYPSLQYDDIALLYPNEELLMSVNGTVATSLFFSAVPDNLALMDDIIACRKVTFLSTYSYGTDRTRSKLLCVQPLPINSTTPKYFALYIINYSTLYNQLFHTSHDSTTMLSMLTDVDGEILWCNNDLLPAYIADLENTEKMVEIDGVSYLFTREHIDIGLSLTVLTKITSQFEKVEHARWMLILFCLLLILLSGVSVFWSIRRGYLPIERILSSYRREAPKLVGEPSSDLETLSQLARHYSVLLHQQENAQEHFPQEWLQDLFVMSVIQGKYTDKAELGNLCEKLNINFTNGEYFICLMLFDQEPDEMKLKALRTAMNNPAEMEHGCISVLTALNSVLCLLNTPRANAEARAQIARRLLQAVGMRATCAVGTECTDIRNLGRSYIEAHTALDYRLIRGRHTVILFDELPAESHTRNDYPTELLRKYSISLKTWDANVINRNLERILEYMQVHRLGLQQSRCICYELTSAFFAEMRAMYGNAVLHLDGLDVFTISEYESAYDLMDNIRYLCDQVRLYLDTADGKKKSLFVNRCLEMMRDNIPNPQFSLESIAESFNVTPQTLRRHFKQFTGSTLINAMTELRIERAKELLAGTKLNICTILEQVGYSDTSSFTRLFKSYTGVSPSQYRETNRKNTNK